MQENKRYIGIDGGGTKTVCILSDENGRILAKATGESSNMQANSLSHVGRVLQNLVARVLADSGSSIEQIHSATIALAGCDRPADKVALSPVIHSFLPEKVLMHIQNDALAALAAGTCGGPGMILIAGTGSIVYSLTASGEMARTGGWGYLLGDEGSGYAIGRAGISAVLKAFDGTGQATKMTDLAIQAWSLNTPADIVPFIYREGEAKHKIASFSKIVFTAAKSSDAVARGIIDDAVDELCHLVESGRGKANLPPDTPIVIGGGLFSEPFFKTKFIETLENIDVVHPSLPPVTGALLTAMMRAGLLVTDKIKTTLQQSWNKIEKGDGARG